jgi:hypothetical protein
MQGGGQSDDNKAESPNHLSDRTRYVPCCVVLLALLAGAAFLLEFGSDLGFLSDKWRPGIGGIGDVERAKRKIKTGMTKDEVRSVVGRPHLDLGYQWEYCDNRLLPEGVLLVRFGDDNRVTSSEWWLK